MAMSVKLRTLYIMKMLLEKTDEEHPLSAAGINKELQKYDMCIDRKTVYSDIEILRDFGLDIVQKYGNKPGYYVGSRTFELPELKLLVDAVQSSKFITTKKSEELIRKLETLAGEQDAKQLQRQVFIYNRPKTGNERIYYTVDNIHTSMLKNSQIRFQYAEWTREKVLEPRREGKFYKVSPWALTWDNQNYYLIGFDEESEQIRHYRVDKMLNAEVADEVRHGKEQFRNFDLAAFAKKTFGMYGGTEASVTIQCKNYMIGVVLDRFGSETMIIPAGEDQFRFNAEVAVSPQFYGWITGLGDGIRIVGPKWVKDDYQEYLRNILRGYEEN